MNIGFAWKTLWRFWNIWQTANLSCSRLWITDLSWWKSFPLVYWKINEIVQPFCRSWSSTKTGFLFLGQPTATVTMKLYCPGPTEDSKEALFADASVLNSLCNKSEWIQPTNWCLWWSLFWMKKVWASDRKISFFGPCKANILTFTDCISSIQGFDFQEWTRFIYAWKYPNGFNVLGSLFSLETCDSGWLFADLMVCCNLKKIVLLIFKVCAKIIFQCLIDLYCNFFII